MNDKAMEAARHFFEKEEDGNAADFVMIGDLKGIARALLATASERDAMAEALRRANAFIGVMFGSGADAIVPETVPSPLGIPVKLGDIARDIRAALAGSPPPDGWRDIPHPLPESHELYDIEFLAAIQVVGQDGRHWEIHKIALDDEVMPPSIHGDYDCGWEFEDFTHWRPLPAPPLRALAMEETDDAGT